MFISNHVATKHMNQVVTIPHSVSPYITVYNISPAFSGTNTQAFTKIGNPATLPTSGANYCSGSNFNVTGDILATTQTSVPRVRFYERNGDVLSLLPDVVNGPSSFPERGGMFHPNNNLYVNGHQTYPFLYLAQRSATTSTRFETLSTASIFTNSVLPSSHVRGVAWNPQGTILSCHQNNAPRLISYWYDGTTFTKLPDPAVGPTAMGDTAGGTWDPEGRIFVTTHATSPWITAYWVNYNGTATTFTKLANPTTLPGNTTCAIGMNNTGSSIAISFYNSPYIHCYNISYNGTNTTLTRVAAFPTSLSNGSGYSLSWLTDDRSLIYSAYSATRFHWITRSGDTFTIQGRRPSAEIPGDTNGPGSIWPKAGNPTK